MSKEIAISVNSLSKIYKLYKSRRGFVKEAIHPFRKCYHKKFHALKNISFKVERGEVLGIIGQNGSGKSTLLKILASVVTPTLGEYYCKGKVTALLELGGGFDRDLTGIQNILFLGALQGYSRSEMSKRIKKILDFADIGEYAYQPVNSYSSGMYMRLAFSISININPEILIVDEVLAVGDIRFQQKCYRKIQEFKDDGKTIVICSQSIDVIKKFCTQAIWLHKGKIKEDGNPGNVTDHYNAFMTSSETITINKKTTDIEDTVSLPLELSHLHAAFHKIKWHDLAKCESFGTGGDYIKYASIINSKTDQYIRLLSGGENVRVLLYVIEQQKIENPDIHLILNEQYGSSVFKIHNNAYQQQIILEEKKPTIVTIDFVFPNISNGHYTISLGLLSNNNNAEQYHHWIHDALIIEVSNPDIKYNMGTSLVIEKATIQSQLI